MFKIHENAQKCCETLLLAEYTLAFDAKYGTHIYDKLMPNGFPFLP